MPTFTTLRAARRFIAGYCVPRVVIRVGREFRIVSPACARRRGAKVIG